MALHTITHANEHTLPKDKVVLCWDKTKSIAWLELSGTNYITTGVASGDQFVTVYVGAKPDKGRWTLVDATTVRAHRDFSRAITLTNKRKVHAFQRRIVEDWSRFNGANPGAWAKGTTFGKSLTSASFIMKALKTGFDAIGESVPAYSGLRASDFEVNDIFAYLGVRMSQPETAPARSWTAEFAQLPPKPFETEDMHRSKDIRIIPVIRSSKPHKGRFAYANDAFTSRADGSAARIPFERVIGYGFRGDTRKPEVIRDESRGFLPNYTRPEHIAMAQRASQPDDEALDLATFLKNQFYGGYISVSKSYAVAKDFVKQGGWIYVCFVEGAYHIPPSGRPSGVKVDKDEQELSMPGMLDWEDVVAFRESDGSGRFTGDVYIRRNFRSEEPLEVFDKIWNLLSGESQG